MHFGVRNGKKECDLQNFMLCIVAFFVVFIKFSLICVFTVIIEQNVPDKESEHLLGVSF